MSRLMGHLTNWPMLKTHVVDGAVICIVLTAVIDLANPRRRMWFWSGPAQIVLGLLLVWRCQLFLLHHVHRDLPTHPGLGGYPSGGCQRAIADMGLMLSVVLRRVQLPKPTVVTLWGVLAALAYGEGYSRIYVEKHYLQDVLAGWALGGVMLLGFVWAGRLLDGVGTVSRTVSTPRSPE
jgi:membrane-associated phospholipid phosphatase